MTLENKGFGQVWQGVLSGMIPGRRSAKRIEGRVEEGLSTQ